MIIFGLGNPGLKYRGTRHNAGHIFLNKLALQRRVQFRTKQGYRIAKTRIARHNVTLVKPLCFMNVSGTAIARFLHNKQDDIMIILDDINLPMGLIRLKKKGSDGGHLGLRSVISALGSSDFTRLRIGVGRPDNNIIDYVLNRFSRDEKKILQQVIRNGVTGIELLFRQGFTKAQNYINGIDLMIKSEARNPKS